MKNINIGKKLALGFGLVVAFMVAVAGSGYWGLKTTNVTINTILDKEAKLSELALRARISILDLRRFEKDFELNMGDKKTQASYFVKWADSQTALRAQLDELEKVATATEDDKAVQAMRNELAAYANGFQKVKAQIESRKISKPQSANKEISKYKDNIHHMEDASA